MEGVVRLKRVAHPNKDNTSERNFEVKEKCYVKNYRYGNKPSWTKAVIVAGFVADIIRVNRLMNQI